jgi:hypothetical protein
MKTNIRIRNECRASGAPEFAGPRYPGLPPLCSRLADRPSGPESIVIETFPARDGVRRKILTALGEKIPTNLEVAGVCILRGLEARLPNVSPDAEALGNHRKYRIVSPPDL